MLIDNFKSRLSLLLILTFLAVVAEAGEIHPYKQPVPLGSYVDDVDALLQRAFAHDNWTLKPQPDGTTFLGEISFKGFEIQVVVSTNEQELSLVLDSVYATECVSACRNLGDQPVMRWLANLRRTIAYELTFLVRDKLSEQAGGE